MAMSASSSDHDRSWPITNATCRAPPSINNAHLLFGHMVPRDALRPAATDFSQFTDDERGNATRVVHQLFLAMVELVRQCAIRRQGRRVRPRHEGGQQRNGNDDPLDELDDATNDGDNDAQVLNGAPAFHVLVECVRRRRDASAPNAPHQFVGYRFWLAVMRKDIKVDDLFGGLMEQLEKTWSADGVANRLGRQAQRKPRPPPLAAWEMWRTVHGRAELAALVGRHRGRAVRDAGAYEHRQWRNPLNPLSASKLFSPFSAFAVGDDSLVVKAQAAESAAAYLRHDDLRTWTLSFPRSELVYAVQPSDCLCKVLHSRMLFEAQRTPGSHMFAVLPALLDAMPSAVALNARRTDDAMSDDDAPPPLEEPRGTKRSAMVALASLARDMGMDVDAEELDESDDEARSVDRRAVTSAAARARHADMTVNGADHESSAPATAYVPITDMATRNAQRIAASLAPGTPLHASLGDQVGDTVRRALYASNQAAAMREYDARCRQPSAFGLSPTMRVMLAWQERNGAYARPTTCAHERIDRTLSSFGNYECWLYAALHEIYHVYGNHRLAALILQATRSAHRQKLDHIAMHILLQSVSGERGKSFLTKEMTMNHLCVPGAPQLVTFATPKALMSDDTNRSDWIPILDEAQPAMFEEASANARAMSPMAGEHARMVKQMLSSGVVTSETMQIDPGTNKRSTKKTRTEVIGAIIGSLNQPLQLTDAVARRLNVFNVDHGAQLPSVSAIESAHMPTLDATRRQAPTTTGVVGGDACVATLDREMHTEHVLGAETEKLIACLALTEVSTHVAQLLVAYVVEALVASGRPEPSASVVQRTCDLARLKAIKDALYRRFFYRGATHRGKAIDMAALCAAVVDRSLFCRVEHTVAALGETYDLLAKEDAETAVVAAMRHVIKSCRMPSTWCRRAPMAATFGKKAAAPLPDDATLAARSRDAGKKAAAPLPDDATLAARSRDAGKDAPSAKSRDRASKGSDDDTNDEAQPVVEQCDPTYASFFVGVGGVRKLARTLQVAMAQLDWLKTKPPVDAIEDCLVQFKSREQMARPREMKPRSGAIRVVTEEPERMMPVAVELSSTYVVLWSFLNLTELDGQPPERLAKLGVRATPASERRIDTPTKATAADVVRAAVKRLLSHQHQRPQTLVFKARDDAPNVRELIEIPAPKSDAPVLVVPLVSRDAEDSVARLSAGAVPRASRSAGAPSFENLAIDTDLDSYALNERNKALGICPGPVPEAIVRRGMLGGAMRRDGDGARVDDSRAAREADDLPAIGVVTARGFAATVSDEPHFAGVPVSLLYGACDDGLGDQQRKELADTLLAMTDLRHPPRSAFARGVNGSAVDRAVDAGRFVLSDADDDTVRLLSARTIAYVIDHDFDPRHHALDDACTSFHWDVLGAPFQRPHTEEELTEAFGDDKRGRAAAVDARWQQNVRAYKMIAPHPAIVDDYEARRHYDAACGVRQHSYAREAVTLRPEVKTRDQRWSRARQLGDALGAQRSPAVATPSVAFVASQTGSSQTNSPAPAFDLHRAVASALAR